MLLLSVLGVAFLTASLHELGQGDTSSGELLLSLPLYSLSCLLGQSRMSRMIPHGLRRGADPSEDSRNISEPFRFNIWLTTDREVTCVFLLEWPVHK